MCCVSVEDVTIRFEVIAEASQPVFAGHFPGNPILPGALLLAHIGHALGRDHGLRVVGINNARFAKPVQPGDVVVVNCDPPVSGDLRFRCEVGDALVAKGRLAVESADD